MGLPDLKADIQLASESLGAVTTVDELKQWMTDNLLPSIGGIVDATAEEFSTRDEVIQTIADDIDELVEQSGDALQPETTGKLLSVYEVGSMIANELEILLKKADDVTKKRVKPMVAAYRQGVLVVGELLAEITIPTDGEDDGEDDGDLEPPDDDVDDEEDDDEDDDAVVGEGG